MAVAVAMAVVVAVAVAVAVKVAVAILVSSFLLLLVFDFENFLMVMADLRAGALLAGWQEGTQQPAEVGITRAKKDLS